MSLSPIRDLPPHHINGTHHRREAAPRPKEMKPLLTHEPLPHDREKKPVTRPPKKRKIPTPTKPALSFDPKRNNVPSGKQPPPMSPPLFSRPSASESSTSTSSYDEQQPTPFVDHEIHDQSCDGYDALKRPRIFSGYFPTEHSTASHFATPCTDMSDISSVPPDLYDSPTSSSSPDLSDQSHCAPQAPDYARQIHLPPPMYPYDSQLYGQQPVVHQDSYYSMDSCPDRPLQAYPAQYFDTPYGRAGPHDVPAYHEGSYPYQPPHSY